MCIRDRFRNESSFARSDAEQRPDHAGRQYVIVARMVARNTSWSDSVEMPWPRRTLITYSKLLHDVSKLFIWSVALSRSLSVMPRTLAQPTRSMSGHGGGGWDDWPHFSRMKISYFDFVRFSLRLFLDAQDGILHPVENLSLPPVPPGTFCQQIFMCALNLDCSETRRVKIWSQYRLNIDLAVETL